MSIDFTTVASFNPSAPLGGGAERISWVAAPSFPAGNLWQCYMDGVLVYAGAEPACVVVVPPGQTARIAVGSVDPADESTSFSADLPAAPDRRILLSWQGGTFEGADIQGFNVFLSAAGQSVSLTGKPAATLPAFPGGSPVASGNFSWTSPDLTSGSYQLAVVPYDTAGNAGTPQYAAATVSVPPLPPDRNALGGRLTYVVNDAGEAPGVNPTVTLDWLPSPG